VVLLKVCLQLGIGEGFDSSHDSASRVEPAALMVETPRRHSILDDGENVVITEQLVVVRLVANIHFAATVTCKE
jgi:hypothetical protein